MGLFTSFFSSKVLEKTSDKKEAFVLIGSLKFELQITREEHYQAALEAISRRRVPKGGSQFETAQLILEDKNPRDKNAVRVEIQGKQVGYLGPKAAIVYRQQLITREMPGAEGQCQAVIMGGWVSSDGRKGPHEVWLDFPAWYQ